MSTEPVFIYEHKPTGTILRSISSGSVLLVIRNLEETARYRMHMNYAPSCSVTGIVYFHDSYGRRTIDLNRPFPQEPLKAEDGNLIHPSGNFIIKYAMKQYPHKYKDKSLDGLLRIRISDGAPETIWSGDTANPKLVPLFGQTMEEAEKRQAYDDHFEKMKKPIEFPYIVMAEDGETWALIQSDRMEIGKGGNRTASIHWNPFHFFPVKAAFDLEKDRIFLSSKAGIQSFRLNGDPDVFWKAKLPCEPYKKYGNTITEQDAPVVSPVIIYKNEILAVVCSKPAENGFDPSWYEVFRFDRETLDMLGVMREIPRRRDADDTAGLLVLNDGSLVWAPNRQPLVILPSDRADYKSTENAKIIGEEEPPRIPHPSESWYIREIGEAGDIKISEADESERKSLARFLLNELQEDRRFTDLMETDVRAFAPYIDQVAEWDDDRLKLFSEMDWRSFWKIMEGLSDASVHKIADRLQKKKLTEADLLSVKLLVGSGTSVAFSVLGDLARTHSSVAEICADLHLMIPGEGPVIERMSRRHWDIAAYPSSEEHQKGLEFPLPHSEYLPEKFGWSCRSPMAHILSVDLSLLGAENLKKSPLQHQHWFLSSGEECCDEAICTNYAYRNKKGSEITVELIADLASPSPRERPEDSECEGCEETDLPEKEYRLVLEPFQSERNRKIRRLGKLGGYPEWWQSPEVPLCPECGIMMFYIGCVYADVLRNDMPDAALYGFHCEHCGIGAQVVQIT